MIYGMVYEDRCSRLRLWVWRRGAGSRKAWTDFKVHTDKVIRPQSAINVCEICSSNFLLGLNVLLYARSLHVATSNMDKCA